MNGYKHILKAINNELATKCEQLKEAWGLNDTQWKEIRKLKEENKALRDDLFELSQHYQNLLKQNKNGKEKKS